MWNQFLKSYVIIASFMTALLLVVIGTQTMPKKSTATAYKDSVFSTTNVEPVIDIPVESTSTTNTTIAEVIVTVPETTTTEVPITTVTTRYIPRTTTTEPYVYVAPTTIPATRSSGSDGPPRNTTTLVGCIAYYESRWGDADPNVFQFVSGTWAAYGGTGSAGNASYATQEAIFWLAWNDAGHHHWAAQKGRCF